MISSSIHHPKRKRGSVRSAMCTNHQSVKERNADEPWTQLDKSIIKYLPFQTPRVIDWHQFNCWQNQISVSNTLTEENFYSTKADTVKSLTIPQFKDILSWLSWLGDCLNYLLGVINITTAGVHGTYRKAGDETKNISTDNNYRASQNLEHFLSQVSSLLSQNCVTQSYSQLRLS